MKVKERLAISLLTLLVVGEAVPCSIANCQPAKCQDLGSQVFRCLGCEEGYYLKGETQCAACAEGCSKCSVSGLCLACLEGYLLTTGAGCAKCGLHCSKCDEKACLVCLEGSFELVEGTCKSSAGTPASISGPTIGYILLGVFVGLFLLFLVRVNIMKKKVAEVKPDSKDTPVKGILKSSDGDSSRLGGRLVITGENHGGEAAQQYQEKTTDADTKASSSSHPTKLTLRSTQNKLVQVRVAGDWTLSQQLEPAPDEPPVEPHKETGSEQSPPPRLSLSQSPQVRPVVIRRVPVKSPSRSPPKDARRSPNLKLAQRKVLSSQIQRISFPYLNQKKQLPLKSGEVEEAEEASRKVLGGSEDQ